MDDFSHLLVRLHKADVRFLVIGGVACALNGFVRTTEDVDILVQADAANLHRLLSALSAWGDGYARELTVTDFPLEPVDFSFRLFNLQFLNSYPTVNE